MTRKPLFAPVPTGVLCLIGSMLLVWGLLAPKVGAADLFEITSARWKPEKAELRIEGRASSPDSPVFVRDADTRVLLGCAVVRVDGKWVLKVRRPKTVPTRMLAECEGVVRQSPVLGAVAVN